MSASSPLQSSPFQVVRQHLGGHPIPGAAFAVMRGDKLEVGYVGVIEPGGAPVTAETVWDLASLTKVLVTVPLLLKFIERGRLDPNAPLRATLPELEGLPLATATVTQLVSHTAGLEALSRLRFWGLPRDEALRRAIQEPRPLLGITYSDQGFIALTYLLERLGGAPIDELAECELFAPIGAKLTYHPDAAKCAATELDASTGKLLRGVVHDENTRALEGVSGHAGLFGSLPEVTAYMTALMAGRVLQPLSLKRMTAEIARADNDARAFGWVLRHDGWLGGERAPVTALGHTGFTGTGIWFNLETRQGNVLLTNRVCPSRDQPSDIATLRRQFNDAAWNG